jgi:hypothetical protein
MPCDHSVSPFAQLHSAVSFLPVSHAKEPPGGVIDLNKFISSIFCRYTANRSLELFLQLRTYNYNDTRANMDSIMLPATVCVRLLLSFACHAVSPIESGCYAGSPTTRSRGREQNDIPYPVVMNIHVRRLHEIQHTLNV